jgi:hypothetical protein
MDLEDVTDAPEVGIAAAAVTALLLSPRVRGLVRRGAVTGLAGLLTTKDTLTGWARHMASGVRQHDATDAAFINELAHEARRELTRQQEPEG